MKGNLENTDTGTSEHEWSHDQTSLSVLGCVDHHSCIQLALSSHKNHASVERARLIYKMFHGVRVNVVRDDLLPSYESCSTSKGKMKEGYKVADIPCIIYRLLQSQHQLKRKPKEKRVPTIQYKKDALLGKEYIANKKEKTRSCKRSCRRSSKKAKKKGNSAPQGSPRAAGKFQIIHLGTVTAPREPIDAKEAQIALEEATNAIQQIGVVMQTLTTVTWSVRCGFALEDIVWWVK
ncbi:hypothetical protein F2Q68_00016230 [Brassica cretica]|uniref:Uncharacterized protein n=1 Tax=Brassica cretica TaxID=69181 RepID=A0A8S9HJQ7_BRACR|nr:hypothetical protein F2Q68_00016230 [Brassica cretica]